MNRNHLIDWDDFVKNTWFMIPYYAWLLAAIFIYLGLMIFMLAVFFGQWVVDLVSNPHDRAQITDRWGELMSGFDGSVWEDIFFVFFATPVVAAIGAAVAFLAFYLVAYTFIFINRGFGKLMGRLRRGKAAEPAEA